MSRLLIHVEGITEEDFVKEVLAPHLYQFGYTVVEPRLLGNSRLKANRGGICSWSAARLDICNILKSDVGSHATIIVDYYGMPSTGPGSWPGRLEANSLPFAYKANSVEAAIHSDVCQAMGPNFNPSRFIPYVLMHEFEALLFSNPTAFAQAICRTDLLQSFIQIRASAPTPEQINDSPQTAPSKRIKNLIPRYEKPFLGVLGILEIGLTEIRSECPLFNNWITRLEQVVC